MSLRSENAVPSENHAAEHADSRQLLTPVGDVPGVVPRHVQLLGKLGIYTVADLLFFFPRDYEDLSDRRSIADLEDDHVQSVRGQVVEIDGKSSGFGKSRVGLLLRDETDELRAIWFNQPFMRNKFKVGQFLLLSGKPRQSGGRWEMAHPRIRWLDDPEEDTNLNLLPIYPLTEGIKQYQLRKLIETATREYASLLEEVFPQSLLDKYQLFPLQEALPTIHHPENMEQLGHARRRFVFQELFVLQLALAARRWQHKTNLKAPPLEASAQIDARIRRLFPFDLTAGQHMVIEEVAADMAKPTPMNRLLQGDVGSGKTVIAVYAILTCVSHSHQAVLMAPTEILARQHADTLGKLLKQSRVRWLLLTGGMPAKQRAEALAEIAAGNIDVVIGTHAVVQEDVEFAKLGLVVIDEQHKFGVRQRAALRQTEHSPHYLVMTATPIPRTVSMALFGDLDVSTLRDMPPGRQAVNTYVVEHRAQGEWWSFVRGKLREGRQAYVVAPLVDESENYAAASVAEAFERLTNGELEAFRVGLLHGRMSSAEKEQTMASFRSGEIQVLVSTTVIEVGVDVPNATLMTVDSPERFGLSQLHQLRGRIGRGTHPGFCALLADEELSEDARGRLSSFANTTDGFELAELDFKMRGPGRPIRHQTTWHAATARGRPHL